MPDQLRSIYPRIVSWEAGRGLEHDAQPRIERAPLVHAIVCGSSASRAEIEGAEGVGERREWLGRLLVWAAVAVELPEASHTRIMEGWRPIRPCRFRPEWWAERREII